MKRSRYALLCAISLAYTATPARAATIYTEDFTSPSKLGNSGATAELGNGGSYSYGT